VILVYLIKSYCVLKISKNKEEIQYILKFYYKKRKEYTTQAKKICDIYGHNVVSVWHKSSSNVFNLEILMSKMHLALVDQSLEESMKSWKKLSKTSTLAVNKEINQQKTVLNYLEKAG